MNKNKNGFISAGIIAIIALSLIILSGGGYEGYKYYQQKKESAKEENKESEVKKELQNIDINKKIELRYRWLFQKCIILKVQLRCRLEVHL